MKFTAQEEYGLRCILRLARGQLEQGQEGNTPPQANSFTLGDIARKEGLTSQYAGKLIRILGKAGLVESARGRKGGYRLARTPDQISVGEAIAALGGRIYQSGICQRYSGDRKFCVHTNDCSIRSLWVGLQEMVDRILSKTSLEDLIGSEKNMTDWMDSRAEVMEDFDPLNPATVPVESVSNLISESKKPVHEKLDKQTGKSS